MFFISFPLAFPRLQYQLDQKQLGEEELRGEEKSQLTCSQMIVSLPQAGKERNTTLSLGFWLLHKIEHSDHQNETDLSLKVTITLLVYLK